MGIATLHPSCVLSCVLCRPCDIPRPAQEARDREIFVDGLPVQANAALADLVAFTGVARNNRGTMRAARQASARRSTQPTSCARQKRTLVAEMVMPCSQNEIAVLYNYLQNIRKFTRIKAVTVAIDISGWSQILASRPPPLI